MDFEAFSNEFLFDLKNNDNHALTLLDDNSMLIEEYFGTDDNLMTLDSFTKDLGKIVIETGRGKFGIIESALEHTAMTTVYNHFINSDVMIRAFQMCNKYAVKWLQTMQINPYVQDEQGRNALMFVVQNSQWNSYIKQYASDERCISQIDNNGRNVLFYCVRNLSGMMELMKYNVNVNQQDCDGNNILLYCCKNEIYDTFNYLVNHGVDVDAIDFDERTVAMHLAIRGKYYHFPILDMNGCNFCYMNLGGETVLSLLLNQMYGPEGDKDDMFNKYTRTLRALVSTNCNFNVPIDDDENTALMVMLLVNDFNTFNFVLQFAKNVDLSITNRYGESATSLFIKNKRSNLFPNVIKHPSFDFNYVDPIYGNNILMLSAITQPLFVTEIIKRTPRLIEDVNNKGETALMLACKADQNNSVCSLLNYNFTYHFLDINAQDHLGNTALYYAVARQNPIITFYLMEKEADCQIKNNQGKSALELARELGDPYVLDALEGRISANTIGKIQSLYRGKEGGDLTVSRGIEEYLYYCIGNQAYSNFELTKNMIKTEKSNYKSVVPKTGSKDEILAIVFIGLIIVSFI